MFRECGRCKVPHDPRRNCRQEDVLTAARAQINAAPIVQMPVVTDPKPVNAKPVADKAQRIVKARAVVNKKQIVHDVVHDQPVVHEVVHAQSIVHDQPIVHAPRGKYADEKKRKAYRAEWMKQDRLKRKEQKAKASDQSSNATS